MTNICYVNVGKILQLKVRTFEEDEDDDDEYEGGLNVQVIENGEVITYHFSDSETLDNFLVILEEERIPYEIVDDDGNLVGWADEVDYNEEDDEY
jgi:hypothetical protein